MEFDNVRLEQYKAEVQKLGEALAEKIGANAIIGVKFDYETIGQAGSMLAVIASGTAVIIEE